VKSTLSRGAAVEQFLERYSCDGHGRIAWLEIRPMGKDAYEVRRYDAEDRGDASWVDVYEWLDGDAEFAPSICRTPEEALEFASNEYGANPTKWVNSGCVQDEYLDVIQCDSH
jgi:hypothetical protein